MIRRLLAAWLGRSQPPRPGIACSDLGHDFTAATDEPYAKAGSELLWLTLYCRRCGDTREVIATDRGAVR